MNTKDQVRKKIAMIAAASKGIGFATAKLLAEQGVSVSMCARSENDLNNACQEIGPASLGIVCDLSNPRDIERWYTQTVEHLGPPSILITNTGGPPYGNPSELSDEQWVNGFESTVLNIVRLTRLATPHMIAQKWGRIVHITSLVAKDPSILLTISSTLRTGLMSLTKLQAKELGPHGITVNAVLPGHTLTARQLHLAEIEATKKETTVEQVLEEKSEQIPLRRLAKPQEIAAPIVFLCSDSASYITGTSLLVDGGSTKGIG